MARLQGGSCSPAVKCLTRTKLRCLCAVLLEQMSLMAFCNWDEHEAAAVFCS